MVNSHVAKRVTVMIDDDLDKALRERQSRKIKKTQSSYSFSKVLNECLRKELKKTI